MLQDTHVFLLEVCVINQHKVVISVIVIED